MTKTVSFDIEPTTYVRVPYGMTSHGEKEIEAVVRALRNSTQMGDHVREFENRISLKFQKNYGVMVNSGSSALQLAVEILDIKKGAEVITPALTFATTVGSILKNSLTPSFVDVGEGSYNINPIKVEQSITSKTRAMVIPNLIGNLADWKVLRKIADKYNLLVVEDSADTLGGTIGGVSSGSYSDISITSFYGSHVINCAGNGGMLCMNSSKHRDRAKLLRSWGRQSSLYDESEAIENRFNVYLDEIRYDAKFVFSAVGYNYEPSEIGASFGLVQLENLDSNIEQRVLNFNAMSAYFSTFEDWFILPKQLENSTTGWLAYPLTIREESPFTRTEMQIFLEKRNIQTRVVFTGNILRQPGFSDISCKKTKEGYPEADNVTRGGLLLACHHALNDEMKRHLYESLDLFFKQF
jgi:CDP-6-deoxy-D-xylo-4-hexulose-3-dehydrase